MKDLIINFKNNNKEKTREYDRITDFIDEMESGKNVIPMSDNVTAMFFENKLNVKQFKDIDELLKHCINITK